LITTTQCGDGAGAKHSLPIKSISSNRYSAVPHTSIGIIITSILASCMLFFFYELLVFGALRIIKAPASTSLLN